MFYFILFNRSSTIDACTTLHEKWQQHHRTWFSSNLLDSENKLVLAEENWRRSRLATNHGTASVSINGQSLDKSYPQRNLRDLMEELRSSSIQNKSKSNSTQPQSDYSTADLIASSDSDLNENEYEDNVSSLNIQSASILKQGRSKHNVVQQQNLKQGQLINQHSIRSHIAQRKKLPTPSPTAQVLGLSSNKDRSDSKSSLEDSVYSSLSNDVYSKITVPHDNQGQHKSLMAETSKDSCSVPLDTSTFPPKIESMINESKTPQTLKEKLKGCALVSESGTASVIEVIEPTLSEEEEFQNSIREMSWNISINGSRYDKPTGNKSTYQPSPKSPIAQGRVGDANFFLTEGKSNSPITIFPRRNDERSSIITITSSNSNTARSSASSSSSYSIKNNTKQFARGNAKGQVKTDTENTTSNANAKNSSVTDYNEDSGSNKYSTYSDISPTKRLLEMGITTDALNDNNNPEFDDLDGNSSQYTSLRQSNNFKNDAAPSLTGSSSAHTIHNSATYVIKKKKPHPTSIESSGYSSTETNNISPSKNSSKIMFTDLDFLQEHFVDESFDSGDVNQLDQDVEKMSSNKKTTFLQKIANKTKWNNMKKKINTTNKENNIETTGYKQNSLNGSPLLSQKNTLNHRSITGEDVDEGLEEHILPDSFEDLPGDPEASEDQSKLINNADEQNNNDEINVKKLESFDKINSRTKSLSPSSRKSFLFSTSSTNNSSSCATIKSSSGISANSVASTSEDSGIGLLASSGSVKISDPQVSPSLKSTVTSNDISKSSLDLPYRSQKELSLPSNPHRMDINGDLSLKNNNFSCNERGALSKIDETSSVASQSSKSCNSEMIVQDKVSTVSLNVSSPYSSKHHVEKMNERNLLDNSGIKNISDRISHLNKMSAPIVSNKSSSSTLKSSTSNLLEQPKLKRNVSNTKAWYDIPSDEDTEAPEADSLASIITHRSHSSEEE